MKPPFPINANIDIPINQIEYRPAVLLVIPRARKAKIPKAKIMCLTVGFGLLVVCYCEATSIVAIRTPNSITIAADSAGTFEGRSAATVVRSVCKISPNGNAFFANDGLAGDPVTHFDVGKIVIRSSKGKRTVHEQAQASAQALIRALPEEIRILKTADPPKYDKIISGEDGIVGVLFFGFEKGVPISTAFGLFVRVLKDGSTKVIPHWRSCPGQSCPTGTYFYMLGLHASIDRYLAAVPGGHINNTPRETVQLLVGLEIADEPKEVQAPIDILEITSSGANWIRHKPECIPNK